MISDRLLNAIQVGLVEGFGGGVEDLIGTPEERAFAVGLLSSPSSQLSSGNYLEEYFSILDLERSMKLAGSMWKGIPKPLINISAPNFTPSEPIEQGALMCVDPNFNPAAQP